MTHQHARPSGAQTVRFSLAAEPTAPSEARRRLGELWHAPDGLLEHGWLVLSELVNNSVMHSGAQQIDVRLTVEPDGLSIEVDDHGTFARDSYTPDRVDGIGLKLLDLFCDRWDGQGGRVTAHLAGRPPAAAHATAAPG